MRVYHFLETRWAEDDLLRRRLKISRFEDLNDPFELLAPELRDLKVRRAFQAVRQYLSDRRGILCFSRHWHNPLLWSHYADKHRGMCLGFDVPKKFIAQVHYDGGRVANAIPVLMGHGPDSEPLLTRLLATKFQDWKYEDEVRVYANLQDRDADTGHYFKEFSKELALREVILGPRFSGSKAQILDAVAAANPRARVIQARLAFADFRVVRDRRGVVV